jgi:cytochrome c-type biogenesis protein
MRGVLFPLVAVVAGAISFASPCCLPLVPGYLSYVAALPVSELGDRQARSVTLRAALLFVAGFTTVFTVLGFSAAALGSVFVDKVAMARVLGLVVIAFGLLTVGLIRIPALQRERRIDLARIPRGPAWAFPMGMAFGAGWVPCIGPVLGTIFSIASVSGTAAWGAVLLVLYSLGLGVPFVLLGLGFNRAQRSLAWLRRYTRRIEIAGGVLLVVVGVLLFSGAWQSLFRPLQRRFGGWGI